MTLLAALVHVDRPASPSSCCPRGGEPSLAKRTARQKLMSLLCVRFRTSAPPEGTARLAGKPAPEWLYVWFDDTDYPGTCERCTSPQARSPVHGLANMFKLESMFPLASQFRKRLLMIPGFNPADLPWLSLPNTSKPLECVVSDSREYVCQMSEVDTGRSGMNGNACRTHARAAAGRLVPAHALWGDGGPVPQLSSLSVRMCH